MKQEDKTLENDVISALRRAMCHNDGCFAEICKCMKRVKDLEQREDAQIECNAMLQWHITEQKIRIDKIEKILNTIREALADKKSKENE